ncbi:MAG: thioredoxin fold domain-containing protein [Alphaproteobacteria bacterium]|nr:thioredoxin fold domain-containing protein [Alphaproteobacteria bacterium]
MRALYFAIFTVFFAYFSAVAPVFAQNKSDLPEIPSALQMLSDRGAQMRYLGREHGMDGWIAIYQGQENYYYVTPDGSAFLMGIMFDKDGEMITMKQVADLQKQGGDVLDFLAADQKPKDLTATMKETNEAFVYKTPAERMFAEVENSNWVSFGDESAPVIYSFMDPQCPHCHSFMKDMKEDYLKGGLIQVRMIPVGFRDETLAQASFLLASPDAEERWYKHLDGDATALPAKQDVNTQGIQMNLALMQAWDFDVTPLTVYRDKAGKVKIVRGRASNLANILADLPSK